jgi:hypothetical protein
MVILSGALPSLSAQNTWLSCPMLFPLNQPRTRGYPVWGSSLSISPEHVAILSGALPSQSAQNTWLSCLGLFPLDQPFSIRPSLSAQSTWLCCPVLVFGQKIALDGCH